MTVKLVDVLQVEPDDNIVLDLACGRELSVKRYQISG
jgi:hypothetical protein